MGFLKRGERNFFRIFQRFSQIFSAIFLSIFQNFHPKTSIFLPKRWEVFIGECGKIEGYVMEYLWTPGKRRIPVRGFFLRFGRNQVLGDVTLVCLCFNSGVCVCESIFLIFILGVITNYWFCIKCDWSPRDLIHFKLLN